jgi:hypothetical protein
VVAKNRFANLNAVAVWQEFLNISVSGESVKTAAEDGNVKSAERRSYILAEHKYFLLCYSRSPGCIGNPRNVVTKGLLDTVNVRGEEIHATLSLNLDIATRLILQRK